jgi:hypothetical protein
LHTYPIKDIVPFFIQTITVGTGITPVRAKWLADYNRRWGITPRPKGSLFNCRLLYILFVEIAIKNRYALSHVPALN